jgi:rhodanese-related sulfurtransferase
MIKPMRYPAACMFLLLAMLIAVNFTSMVRASEEAIEPEIPKEKQTSLGLYVTAAEAYEKWQADNENIKILDVRTTEEYLFIGHAPMGWNVPFMSQSYEWDPDKEYFKMKPNPVFIDQVQQLFKPSDTILVMCRSGPRGAMAVNQLAEAGFTHVFNITDGMEGDAIRDPESLYNGQRLKNGWKNSGIPWTYDVKPEQMRFTIENPQE